MNQNSLQAWKEIVLPTLRDRQLEVFKVIANSTGITIYEVARVLERFPNQVSGRFSELVRHDLIIIDELCSRKIDNRQHSVWILTEKGKQLKEKLNA